MYCRSTKEDVKIFNVILSHCHRDKKWLVKGLNSSTCTQQYSLQLAVIIAE